ncbi:MAG: hypothetical protein ABWZ25_15805 [Chitinophagaceae bacterium]
MHEFFLTRADGTSVFEKVLPQERLDYLQQESNNRKDSINTDLEFSFPEDFGKEYASMHLKLVPAYSGFRLVARVNPLPQLSGEVMFAPYSTLPDGLNFFILVKKKNVLVDSYTNARRTRSTQATWFFSNDDVDGAKTSPFLTNAISGFNAASVYEQGELYKQGADIIPYYNGTDVNDKVTGSAFANENDRLLLPLSFVYSFPSVTGMTEVKFNLKDKDGVEVFTQTLTGSEGIPQRTTLSLLNKVQPLPLVSSAPIADFVYTLETVADNGYQQTQKIIFSDELASAGPWAVIHFRFTPVNPAFSMADATGLLKTKKDLTGVLTGIPVFEIAFKSRFAYWRFLNNQGLELDIKPSLLNYVTKEGKSLLTKRPVPLTRDFFLLREKGSAATIYVPNPQTGFLSDAGNGRLALDIRVPQSELFPTIP